MVTPGSFRGQRIVGGNPALDLLNTQNGPAGEPPKDDVLNDYRDVLAWASHVGVLSATVARSLGRQARLRPAEAEAAFRRVIETRAYLHGLFDAIAHERPPAAENLLRLQRDAADALAHGRIAAADGQYQWSWTEPEDLGRPLWPIVHAALTLLTDGPRDRIKGCSSCRFLFIDESKNRSRRWCSMEDCGAEDKMRNYVARRSMARASRASE